jgi:hypothetical protein
MTKANKMKNAQLIQLKYNHAFFFFVILLQFKINFLAPFFIFFLYKFNSWILFFIV